MPTVKKATAGSKKATARKPPEKVRRKVEVAVELKGTGCNGQAVMLSMKLQDGKVVIEAQESEGDGSYRRVRSANGTFKTTPQDLRRALDLLTQPITVRAGGEAETAKS